MKSLSQDMENVNTINKYREIYKYHKKNPEDKQFAEEYYSELSVYKKEHPYARVFFLKIHYG